MAGKKETVLDLGKFIDKGVRVKLSGGREGACLPKKKCAPLSLEAEFDTRKVYVVGATRVSHPRTRAHARAPLPPYQVSPSPTPPTYAVTGTLKGFDQLLNLVLDECLEYLRDPEDPLKITDQTRNLGLIVCRGTSVMVVSGLDGMEEIANPFLPAEGEIDVGAAP